MDDNALRGIPWTMLSYVVARVVTVGTTLVLARLLVPADFGLFALATLGTGFISIFSGLGLGTALVLLQDLDRRGEGTVLSLLMAAGVLFAGILAAIAPALSALFHEPRLTPILLALAGVLCVSGINWFYDSLLQKELAFRVRFVTQMVRTVVFAAVALVLATHGVGVWALVGAHIAGHVANTIGLYAMAPYRVPFAWERSNVRRILTTGRGFVVQEGAEFLQQNADYIVIGRLLPTAQLGYYTMAYRQAEMPNYAVADPVSRVTFPAFSAMRHRGEDIMPAFLGTVRMVALASLPMGVILSAAAGPFTHALLGPQWPPMIGPLSVLGVWAIVRPLALTTGWLLNSLGHADVVGKVSLLLLAVQVAVLYVAADRGGIVAVSWVMLGHITATLVVLMVITRRVTGTSVGRQWLAIQPLMFAAAVSWVATRWVATTVDLPSMLLLIACSLTAVAVYLVAVRILVPSLLGRAIMLGRRTLSRRPAGQPVVASSA